MGRASTRTRYSSCSAGLIARSLVVAEEEGLETRYRLLETIRQYGEECLSRAGETERWQARRAGAYADLLGRDWDHAHDRNQEYCLGGPARRRAGQPARGVVLGDVRRRQRQYYAFQILAGFAPCEIWTTYPLKLTGEAAVGLPGAAEHRGYPLALADSTLFASIRADATSAEELGRRAAEADARCDTPDWRVEATILTARSNIAAASGAFPDAARLAEQAAGQARRRPRRRLCRPTAGRSGLRVLAGDAPRGVPLAREALVLARKVGAPALIATAVVEVGATIARAPTPSRHVPTCAKASSSARRWASRRAPQPGSPAAKSIASALNNRTPPSNSPAAPSAACSGAVTAYKSRHHPAHDRRHTGRFPARGCRDHPGRRRSPCPRGIWPGPPS